MNSIGTLFGRPIAQYWEDLALWETVLNENPQLNQIIEFGTWQGGMSYFLWAQAQAREMEFTTLDINKPDKEVPEFYQFDIFKRFKAVWGNYLYNDTLIFCDNGDKPKEVALVAPMLTVDSIIAIHDWGTEFVLEDIPDDWFTYRLSSTTIFIIRRDKVFDARNLKGR
jgi:hypothetical protein